MDRLGILEQCGRPWGKSPLLVSSSSRSGQFLLIHNHRSRPNCSLLDVVHNKRYEFAMFEAGRLAFLVKFVCQNAYLS